MRKTGGREKTGGKHRDANVFVTASVRVFLYSKIGPHKSFAKGNVSGGTLRSESDVSTLYDIV